MCNLRRAHTFFAAGRKLGHSWKLEMSIYVNEIPFYVLFKALMPFCMDICAKGSFFRSGLVDFGKSAWVHRNLHRNKEFGVADFWKAHFSIRVRPRTCLSNTKGDFKVFNFLMIFGQNLIKFWGNFGKIGKIYIFYPKISKK